MVKQTQRDIDQEDLAKSIESGEYYRTAVHWYSTIYHAPIGERAILIVITGLTVLTIFMVFLSVFSLWPLADVRPVISYVPQTDDKIARVIPLMDSPRDDPNVALRTWFLIDYIRNRESYDVNKQESFNKRTWALSSEQVYSVYAEYYRSMQSPTIRYERHTKRIIDVRTVQLHDSHHATIEFVAVEDAPGEDRKSYWQADIHFDYKPIEVNQYTGTVTPMAFKVTEYQSKQTG